MHYTHLTKIKAHHIHPQSYMQRKKFYQRQRNIAENTTHAEQRDRIHFVSDALEEKEEREKRKKKRRKKEKKKEKKNRKKKKKYNEVDRNAFLLNDFHGVSEMMS